MNEHHDEAQDQGWQHISELLRKADCVPDAPDCRSAVMAKIARPKRTRVFTWAYATGVASLIVAAIIALPFLKDPTRVDKMASSPAIKQAAPAETKKPDIALFSPPPASKTQPKTSTAPQRSEKRKPVMMAKADSSEEKIIQRGEGVTKTDTPELRSDYYAADHVDLATANRIKPDQETKSKLATGYSYARPNDSNAGEWHTEEPSPTATAETGDRGLALGVEGDKPDRRAYADAAAAPLADGSVDNSYATHDYAPAPSVAGALTAGSIDRSPDRFAARSARPGAKTLMSMAGVTPAPASGGTATIGMPMAIAMVTWPSNAQPRDSYDYAYTNRDTATGDTTECRVKRSGNSVEIYIETKPAAPEPPVKGSLEHDTTPNA